jgi:hypothetical protein
MPYKWTPPPGYSELVLPGGKTYAPGEMVPISKAAAQQMMASTDHRFEGLEAEPAPAPTETPTPPAP